MNKLTTKIISIGLCAALSIGSTGAVFALAGYKPNETKQEANSAAADAGKKENEKDETVYVMAGTDGSVQKIIVSDWIKNELGSALVSDMSELTDIENVKGDESCTVNDDNVKVWDVQGRDLYYQGNIEKELPIGLSVTYKLDGRPVSGEEIAGKSGKITIRFDYDNRQYEMVDIGGRQEKIYVPFAVLTGMLLDSDTFRNVEVSNGKLINDGDRIAVIGFAFPGLQENLALRRDKLEIPDYVEITADVTDFELGMTVSAATNELFNEFDADKLDSADGLADSLKELTDGMNQLLDGSSALYDGLCTLLEKSNELTGGVNQLTDGAKAVLDGAGALDSGAAQLDAGAAELTAGLNKLSSNNAALNGGAKQVFDTLLSAANTQLAAAGVFVPALTAENYSNVLDSIISSLDETAVYNQALAQVRSAVEGKRSLIEERVTAAVRAEVSTQVTDAVQAQVKDSVTAAVEEQVASQVIAAAAGMSKTDYDAAVAAGLISKEDQTEIEEEIAAQMAADEVQAEIETNTAVQMESDEIASEITANVNSQMQSETVRNTIAQNVELKIQQAVSENMASDEVQSQLAASSEGAKSIISLKASLDSYNAFYLGLLSYTDGVASAAAGAAVLSSGASDLKEGTSQLASGSASLYYGAKEMQDRMPALADGIKQLKDGAMKLSDGLKKFNEEGIRKIADLVGGDLENITARLKATADVSKGYRSFAGISDNMDGQVKFIFRTDEIKAEN